MTTGIYKITNIKNNKCYIGSSNNIEKRWEQHLYQLQNNTHHSIKLQRSYNKSKDKSVFKFEIIEEVPEEQLKEREQYYIDLYNSFNDGYNCCSKVDNPQYSLSKISLKKAYEEFMSLYEQYQDSFIFGRKFLMRLVDKHYKPLIYKNVINIMKWFLDNYNSTIHVAIIRVIKNQQYFLSVADKDKNIFVSYRWYKNKMYIDND